MHGKAFAGRRCLVTGGLGFIGGHLTEALSALGADVVIFDNVTGGNDRPYVDAVRSTWAISKKPTLAEKPWPGVTWSFTALPK